MAKNIAVLGDPETVKGFSAIGLDIYPCSEAEEASKTLRGIADSERYAIIYITEEIYNALEKERTRYSDRLTPALIPIPGSKGNTGAGRRRLSRFVEQAVGSDIIFND